MSTHPTFTTIQVRPFTEEQVQVPAIATAVPALFLVPLLTRREKDGPITVGRGWAVTHEPTGLYLPLGWSSRDPEELQRAVAKVAHLDWSTSEQPYTAEHRRAWMEALRVEDEVDPSPEEKPTQYEDGKGMPRQAEPMVGYLIDWWHRLNKVNQDTPIELDGKHNQLWTHQIFLMVGLYGVTYTLSALRAHDPAVADQVAAALSDAWDTGETAYEWMWQWRNEASSGQRLTLRGVPVPNPTDLLGSADR